MLSYIYSFSFHCSCSLSRNVVLHYMIVIYYIALFSDILCYNCGEFSECVVFFIMYTVAHEHYISSILCCFHNDYTKTDTVSDHKSCREVKQLCWFKYLRPQW